jgi:aminomethyltransferase
MNEELKKTRLHPWHTANGATMAGFGGYDMPLWYASAKNEHLSVLTTAGIFDTSHMAEVMISGTDAYDLLQLCFTQNLDACIGKNKLPLSPGRCIYGAFLDENGEVIDDAIVYMLAENHYMVVINAGMGGTIAGHLITNSGNRNVHISDMTDMLGKMDIQGMMSAKILSQILVDPENVFDKMPYFSFKGHFDPAVKSVRLKDGTPILLSRTGYTGEFGFEIFIQPDHFVKLWEMLLTAGKNFGVTACGLAARDSLRAGAVLPLSHQDIGHWRFINHPWYFALPFDEEQKKFSKKFIGSQSLLNLENPEYTYPFAGDDLRKVTVSDPAIVVDSDNQTIGTVLSCVTDMGIGRHNGQIFSIASPNKPADFQPKGLSCGFIKVNRKLDFGEIVELRDKRRKISVRIVKDIRPDRTARL